MYGGRISELKSELSKRIRWAIENPKDVDKFFKTSIEVFVNTIPLVDNPQIHYLSSVVETDNIELEIDVHNSTKRIIESTSFQVGLITPSDVSGTYFSSQFPSEFPRKRFKLSDTSYLLLIENTFELLPESWDKFPFTIIAEHNIAWKIGEQLQITLRVFSRDGTQDYPFTIMIDQKNP